MLPISATFCCGVIVTASFGRRRNKIKQVHYSTFTKLWQSCSHAHLKIRPIAIFALYSLDYSLAARLQDNSRPKSPTKVETKRKLQQFTVSGWLIINGGARDSEKENFNIEIIFNMKSVQLPAFVCMNHYFQRLLISS